MLCIFSPLFQSPWCSTLQALEEESDFVPIPCGKDGIPGCLRKRTFYSHVNSIKKRDWFGFKGKGLIPLFQWVCDRSTIKWLSLETSKVTVKKFHKQLGWWFYWYLLVLWCKISCIRSKLFVCCHIFDSLGSTPDSLPAMCCFAWG